MPQLIHSLNFEGTIQGSLIFKWVIFIIAQDFEVIHTKIGPKVHDKTKKYKNSPIRTKTGQNWPKGHKDAK